MPVDDRPVRCGLTTPHKLQGRGAVGKPAVLRWAVSACNKPMAAPCLLHAVVRRHARRRWPRSVAATGVVSCVQVSTASGDSGLRAWESGGCEARSKLPNTRDGGQNRAWRLRRDRGPERVMVSRVPDLKLLKGVLGPGGLVPPLGQVAAVCQGQVRRMLGPALGGPARVRSLRPSPGGDEWCLSSLESPRSLPVARFRTQSGLRRRGLAP